MQRTASLIDGPLAFLPSLAFAQVTRVDWTFTPKLSLPLFAQPLLASAEFIDYKEFARPRAFDFEVYGRDAGTITRDDATSTSSYQGNVVDRPIGGDCGSRTNSN